MAKLQAGFVGLNRGSGLVHSLANHPHVEIAALCDIDNTTLQAMGADFSLPAGRLFTNYDDFLAAPMDFVVIATPIEFHARQAIAALESGRHVLCEQTAAYTLPECAQLVNTVNKTGLVYMMVENYCYYHYIREWKRWIDQGKLGHIFHAEGEYIHEIRYLLVDPQTGERYWRYYRAPIWYCAHCLGPLLTLMDDRIVRATGVHSGRHVFPYDGLGCLDMEVGLFQTQKGATIKILRSHVAARHPELVYYSLYGVKGFLENGRHRIGTYGSTRGRLFLEDEMASVAARETTSIESTQGAQEIDCPTADPNASQEALAGGHGDSEYYLVRDFIRAIETNTKPPIDVVRAMDFTVPGLIAHEAAMQGGVWLDVPLF
jgi:predicted dehydrogenase